VDHRPPPDRAQRKVGRNLRILEKAMAAGDRSSRTLFYYGNELRHLGRHEAALNIYREYLQTTRIAVWERYVATLYMASCAQALGHEEETFDLLLAAVKVDRSRAEAFLRLGMHCYTRQEWRKAISFLSAACSAVRPEEGFIEEWAYSSGPWDYLSLCHSRLGMYEEAMADATKALRTSDDKARLVANIEFNLRQLSSSSH